MRTENLRSQFHPEVDLTENGKRMLENLRKYAISGCLCPEDRINTSIEQIKDKVGNGRPAAGKRGVDSAVSAALLLRPWTDNIYAIHVDHGLMRKNESDIICENFKNGPAPDKENAEDVFNSKVEIGRRNSGLNQIIDPEEKRNLVGRSLSK